MPDSFVELIKSFLIPGTLTFLLFAMTAGLLLAVGPRRTRFLALPALTALAAAYWLAAVPAIANLLGTRFHGHDSAPATAATLGGARAIVVLGAGIRTTYTFHGHTLVVPDPQTIYNAMEGARLYHMVEGGLPVLASGGRRDGAPVEATESGILREWLVRGGVPEDRIVLESGSRTTHEQAALVSPLLKQRGWERFALITPAVQGPRAVRVFQREGVDPIAAPAPFWAEEDRSRAPGWVPTGGALRVSERATYDYLAWAYYWWRGWL